MAQAYSDPLALFYRASNPMLVADDNRRYVAVNEAACSLLKIKRQELIGSTIDSITPKGHLQYMEEAWEEFLNCGSLCGRYQVVAGDGSVLDVEFNSTANVLPGRHLTIFVMNEEEEASSLSRKDSNSDEESANKLSPRETQIMQLMAEGHRGREIAVNLGLSPDTVRVHIRNAMRKLEARTRAQAVAIALRDGIIDLN